MTDPPHGSARGANSPPRLSTQPAGPASEPAWLASAEPCAPSTMADMTGPTAAAERTREDVKFAWEFDGARRVTRLLSIGYIGQLGIIVTVDTSYPDQPLRPTARLGLPGRIVPSGAKVNPASDDPERIALADAINQAVTFEVATQYAFEHLQYDAWMDDTDRDGMRHLTNVSRHMTPGPARDLAVTLIQDGFAGTTRELIAAATGALA